MSGKVFQNWRVIMLHLHSVFKLNASKYECVRLPSICLAAVYTWVNHKKNWYITWNKYTIKTYGFYLKICYDIVNIKQKDNNLWLYLVWFPFSTVYFPSGIYVHQNQLDMHNYQKENAFGKCVYFSGI